MLKSLIEFFVGSDKPKVEERPGMVLTYVYQGDGSVELCWVPEDKADEWYIK